MRPAAPAVDSGDMTSSVPAAPGTPVPAGSRFFSQFHVSGTHVESAVLWRQ